MNTQFRDIAQKKLQSLPAAADLLTNTSAEDLVDQLRLKLIEAELKYDQKCTNCNQFQQVFQHTPLATAIFTADMTYIAANNRWISHYNLSGDPESLIGRSHYDVFPDISDEWRAIHQRCLQGESDYAEQAQFERADGRIEWLRWLVHPWYEADGTVGGLIMHTEVITDTIRAKQQAQHHYDRLQQIIEQSPVGIVITDLEGQIIQSNPAYRTFVGQSDDTLQDMMIEDIIHPADVDSYRHGQEVILNKRNPIYQTELRYQHANQSTRWGKMTATSLRDEADTVTHVMAIVEDVTEKREVITQLKASEARFRELFNFAPVPMLITHPETENILDYNHAFLDASGYEADDLDNMIVSDFYRDDTRRRAFIEEVMTQGQDVHALEIHAVRADGSDVWVLLSITQINLQGDEVILSAGLDITSLKQTQRELQQKERELRVIFDLTTNAILIADDQKHYVDVNQTACDLLGYTYDELIGMSLEDLAYDQDVDTLNVQWEQFRQQEEMGGEFVLQHREGHRILTEFRAIANIISGKHISILRDITDERAMLNKLQNSEQRYRSVVEQQTELICRYTPDLHLTFVNEAYCHTLKRKRDEVIGQQLLELIPIVDREQVQEHIYSLTLENPTASATYRLLSPDSQERWYQWQDRAFFNDAGDIIEYQGVGRDVTNSHRIKEVLYFVAQKGWQSESSDFLDAITHYITDTFHVMESFIGVLTDDGESIETLSVNHCGIPQPNITYSLHGTPCDDVIGRSLCIYPKDVASLFPDDHLLEQINAEAYMGIPLWDSANHPLGVIVITHDQSFEDINILSSILQILAVRVSHHIEQMQTTRQLRRSREQYRSLIDAMAEGVIMQDHTGTIITANKQAEYILGLNVHSEHDPTALQSSWEVIHKNGHSFTMNEHPAVTCLRTSEMQRNVIMSIQTVERGRRWISINAVPLLDMDTEPYAVVSSFTDITERKQAEQRLEASERRFRHLFEQASIAIFLLDEQQKVILANQAASSLFDCSADELQGSTLPQLLPISDVSIFEDANSKQQPVTLEIEFTPDTETHYLALTTGILPQQDEFAYMVFIQDITERKHAEEAKHRTQMLEHDLRKERELRDLKTRFVSLVSHEFRTPLAIIMTSTSYLRLAQDRLTQANLLKRLERIERQIKRLDQMIDDVTTINKANNVTIQPQYTDVPILDILQQAMEEIPLAYPDRDVSITLTTNNAVSTWHTDEVLINQIIQNLLSNAVKYSDTADAPVNITIQSNATAYELIVQDHGIGIPENEVEYLFTDFYRATNVENIQGTGLGLMIVKQAVDALNGTISVSSELGVGTTFNIQLPNPIRK